MAKKKLRKDDDGEEEEFGPPPFEEKKFYSTEVEGSKTTLLAVLWAMMAALMSAGVYALTGQFAMGVALGVAAFFVVRPFMGILRISTENFDKTRWLGVVFSYFATWLAIWIVMVNPPVMDLIAPELKDSTPRKQEIGREMMLVISASDNSGISSLSVEVTTPSSGVQTFNNFTETTPRLYRLNLPFNETGNYSYKVRAEDPTGHAAVYEGRMEIVSPAPPAIELIAPSNGSDVTYDQAIMLRVTDNAQIAGVYYTLDTGTEHIILKMEKSSKYGTNIYRIRSNQQGHTWTGGVHTVNVFAVDAAQNSANATYTFTLK